METKKEELVAAIEKNEEEPPTELLESVPIPPIDSIVFHPIEQHRNFGPKTGPKIPLPEFDVDAIAQPFQFDQVNSAFVSLSAFINTEGTIE